MTKYDRFFNTLKLSNVEKIIEDSRLWNVKLQKMPKLRVISKKNIKEEIPILTETPKPLVSVIMQPIVATNQIFKDILANHGQTDLTTRMSRKYEFNKITARLSMGRLTCLKNTLTLRSMGMASYDIQNKT